MLAMKSADPSLAYTTVSPRLWEFDPRPLPTLVTVARQASEPPSESSHCTSTASPTSKNELVAMATEPVKVGSAAAGAKAGTESAMSAATASCCLSAIEVAGATGPLSPAGELGSGGCSARESRTELLAVPPASSPAAERLIKEATSTQRERGKERERERENEREEKEENVHNME